MYFVNGNEKNLTKIDSFGKCFKRISFEDKIVKKISFKIILPVCDLLHFKTKQSQGHINNFGWTERKKINGPHNGQIYVNELILLKNYRNSRF